jgi:two-component system chemotaxis response regulator CheB
MYEREGPPGHQLSLRGLCPDAAFDVVVIAASAGGIEAIKQILPALPGDFPAAILVQMHLNPRYHSVLPQVFQPTSRLPVDWAAEHTRLRPGTVTVAPPGQHVRVTPSGQLHLTSWEQLDYRKPTADGLLVSVAASFAARAIGVVLTGYLSDGARGVRAVQQRGGRVLVQHPATAQVPEMPSAAIATGCVDFALPLPALTAALISLVMVPGAAQLFAVPGGPADQPYRFALRMWRV